MSLLCQSLHLGFSHNVLLLKVQQLKTDSRHQTEHSPQFSCSLLPHICGSSSSSQHANTIQIRPHQSPLSSPCKSAGPQVQRTVEKYSFRPPIKKHISQCLHWHIVLDFIYSGCFRLSHLPERLPLFACILSFAEDLITLS